MIHLVLLLLIVSCTCQELRTDPAPIIYPGQVNIGFLSNVHGPPDNGTEGCGPLRPEAVQRAMAAVWAAYQANFRKEDSQDLNIGVYIFDTCGRDDVAERQVYRLLGHVGHVQTTDCSEKRIPPLFAVLTEGDWDSLEVPLKLLNAFSVPVISTTQGSSNANLLSTAPSTEALARAAVSVLRHLRLLEVAVMAEDDPPSRLFQDFSRQAQVSGMQAIPLDHGVQQDNDEFLATLKVLSEYGKDRLKAVVFLVGGEQALEMLRSVDDKNLPEIPWVVVTPSDISSSLLTTFDRKQLQRLRKVLLLSPESSAIPEFDTYFQQLLEEDTIKHHPLLMEYLSVQENTTTGNVMTPTVSSSNISRIIGHSADVSSTVKAVHTLAAALKAVQKRSCRRGTDCLLYLKRSLSSYVARAATGLDQIVTSETQTMRLKFDEAGSLTTIRYGLRGFTNDGDIMELGFYSDEEGLRVDQDILFSSDALVHTEVIDTTPKSDLKLAFSLDQLLPLTKKLTRVNVTEETTASSSVMTEKDYVEWKILDDVESAIANEEAGTHTTSSTKSDIDVVLPLQDEGNLQHLSDGNSSFSSDDDVIVLGPSYANEHKSRSAASNLRSISLTSHQEPRMNDAFRAESVLHSEEKIIAQESATSSSAEDVKVVRAGLGRHVSAWLGRPWALSVLGVCGFLILATLYILVFLMVKACEGSLKKTNCCLAGAQLVALLCLYIAAALYTWKPSALLCGLQRLMPNVSLSFCYGCLLLKGMYLRAQISLGLGGSVNRCNQMLTLLFIVSVQIALETQWWLIRPPSLAEDTLECLTGKIEILQSQLYITFLLLLTTAVAVSTRRIPYNQPESRSLIATSLCCLVIFLSWDVACWLLPDSSSRNIAYPSALMATALSVLLGIFGPQLFAIHKYGGFPHKPLSYADSLSTVFTMFKDLDNASSGGTTARGKKNAKTLETPFATELGEGTRNPLYSDYQSAYP